MSTVPSYVHSDDDVAAAFMSRYMIVKYIHLNELAKDATRASQALCCSLVYANPSTSCSTSSAHRHSITRP